jgi:hypothetical protein
MSERPPGTFAGFGHGVNLLAPERCVSEVRKFLAEQRKTAAPGAA